MYKYKIGPVYIGLEHLNQNNLSSQMELFHVNTQYLDRIYTIYYVNKIKKTYTQKCEYLTNQFAVIKKDNRKFFYYFFNENIYAVLKEEKVYQLFLDNNFFSNTVHPYFLPSLLHLEQLLLKKRACILHSSYISINKRGIVFTAPSGGGKSTQAELWKKYKNAGIVNGDKSIIGKENGKWYAYGIPFSGSSEYCLNRTCPLKAIVILDKGPLNTLIPVGIRGFSNVFSQVTVNPWDKEFCNKAMDLVMDVCNEVPIYYYSCTKTPEAVEVLYQEFIEKGILNGSV